VTIRSLGARTPVVADSAFVSEAAYVVGDVTIGEQSSVWPGAVVRGDFGPIVIGAHTHIEDNCVVHSGPDGCSVGDHVLCGHAVVLHCGKVGDHCLIGNNATLLDDAVVGDLCTVAAGALLLPGTNVPDGSFVAGVPATVRPATPEQLARLEMLGSLQVGYNVLMHDYLEAGL
jgi:carbonic anhydrase/acetyltransferase-like protein (isoleucine patch superfamily)